MQKNQYVLHYDMIQTRICVIALISLKYSKINRIAATKERTWKNM